MPRTIPHPKNPKQRREQLERLLTTEQHAITNALRVFARDMREASDEAFAAFKAGKDDPAVKAAQDESILTNNGLVMSARLFAENADKATQIADEIDMLLSLDFGDEDDL